MLNLPEVGMWLGNIILEQFLLFVLKKEQPRANSTLSADSCGTCPRRSLWSRNCAVLSTREKYCSSLGFGFPPPFPHNPTSPHCASRDFSGLNIDLSQPVVKESRPLAMFFMARFRSLTLGLKFSAASIPIVQRLSFINSIPLARRASSKTRASAAPRLAREIYTLQDLVKMSPHQLPEANEFSRSFTHEETSIPTSPIEKTESERSQTKGQRQIDENSEEVSHLPDSVPCIQQI